MKSVLFTAFGFPVHSYGLMLVIGFIVGLVRANKRAKLIGIDQDKATNIAVSVLLAGIVGASLTYTLLHIQTESPLHFYRIWEGGLSFHGGIIFGAFTGYIYSRSLKISFLKLADLFAPSIAIAYGFTRIGCFLNGCCYGCPTDLPWGARFWDNGGLTPPSHPTQLYASAASFVIFLLLTRVEMKNKPTGAVFAAYIVLYSIYRFLIEYLRSGYTAEVWLMGHTQAQWFSLLSLIFGVLFYLRVTRVQGS